jgi:RND superfamily putative drug exporter
VFSTKVKARKPLWVAIVVIIAWFGISGATGPLFGNLSSVQKNDNADFLPANVEAQKFANEAKDFSANSDKSLPALVLFEGTVTPSAVGQATAF